MHIHKLGQLFGMIYQNLEIDHKSDVKTIACYGKNINPFLPFIIPFFCNSSIVGLFVISFFNLSRMFFLSPSPRAEFM